MRPTEICLLLGTARQSMCQACITLGHKRCILHAAGALDSVTGASKGAYVTLTATQRESRGSPVQGTPQAAAPNRLHCLLLSRAQRLAQRLSWLLVNRRHPLPEDLTLLGAHVDMKSRQCRP